MRVANLLRNTYFSKDPFFLIFFVTARCNARCKFCFNWDNITQWKSRQELTIDEVEKMTNNIRSFQQLTISGGEPFLRKDLDEICTLFHKNSRVQFITIPTNGLQADRTEEILTRALKKNPKAHFRIGLSTSGIHQDLDDIYGIKDSFRKHQETYRMLKGLLKQYSNLNIDCSIVFSKYSEQKISNIVQYVLKNMPEANPIISLVRGNPRLPESHEYDVESLENIYAYVKNEIPKNNNRFLAKGFNIMRDMLHEMTVEMILENRMVIPCKSGQKMLVVYDNGDVFPCELLDDKMGNLREHNYDIHQILKTQKAKKVVRDIVENKCFCTWECALNNNIIFSPKYSSILIRNYLLDKVGLYKPLTMAQLAYKAKRYPARKETFNQKITSKNTITTRRKLKTFSGVSIKKSMKKTRNR
jgi:radical SAM protein with 4Fe4S-binding SPASM domain